MSLFVLDTAGNRDLLHVDTTEKDDEPDTSFRGRGPLAPKFIFEEDIGSEEEDDGDYGGLPPPSVDISSIINKALSTVKPKTKAEQDMERSINQMKAAGELRASNKHKKHRYPNRQNKDLILADLDLITGKSADDLCETNVDEEMKSSTNDALEKKKGVPRLPDKRLRDMRRIERSKTKGEGWFNMPATEVTDEVKNDLKILQMRSVLNPKHFYKKNDLKVLPKFFQMGTVMHSPLDHYKERDTRRNKKKTIVDELLADADFLKYTKRKFKEVSARNDMYKRKKAMRKMKKLKKNK